MQIHSTALIDKDTHLGINIKIGAYSVVQSGVKLGDGCDIGNFVLIKSGTTIGRNNKIYEGTVIGNPPQDVTFNGEKSFVNIGSDNVIREYVTINRATGESEETKIGDRNYIMAYCHIAHNVRIGNSVVIANCTQLAGYVEVFDYAFISGLCPIHQFVRVGEYSIIGGGFRVPKDVLPYSLSAGNPLKARGLNHVGLKRHNFSKETISILKKAYKFLLSEELNTRQSIVKIREELPLTLEVKRIIEFLETTKRGVAI